MDRNFVAKELTRIAELLTASVKYRDYTIERSGFNFYVKDPSGHRAFEEVAATIQTAKKWIDMEINEKRNKAASRGSLTAMARGPVWEALEPRWNDLHDLEFALEEAGRDYDFAASYGGKGGAAAKKVLSEIGKVKEELEKISSDRLSELTKMEMEFVKDFGMPSDFVRKSQDEMGLK